MDNDEFIWNFGEFVNRHAAALSEIDAMNVDSVDFNSELRQIEREIDRCKPTLQGYRDESENIETEICNVRQLQRKARFVLNNVRSEEQDLHERFKNISIDYDTCVERSGGYEDPNETIRAKISELTTLRTNLSEDLAQMRRRADSNAKKLVRVKAMIAEQEDEYATQIRKLKEISESACSFSPDIKKRMDNILRCRELDESDGH